MSFHNLGLSKPLLDALAAKNYSQATPIQTSGDPDRPDRPRSARHCPDRHRQDGGVHAAVARPPGGRPQHPEAGPDPDAGACADPRARLADRGAAPRPMAASCACRSASSSAAFPTRKSVRTVARGLDVLVATPGRLLDLIDQRALSLRELEILVLDEADQMLDLGFIHALKRIVSLVPAKRQTLFFSATMPKAIKELADKYLTNPAEVAVTPVAKTADRVEQKVVMRQPAGKDRAADHVPSRRSRSSGPWSSAAPSMAPTRSSAMLEAAGIAGERHPRQQEPGAARAGDRRSSARANAGADRDRHRRARDRHSGRQPRHQLRSCRKCPSNMSTASAAPRAPAPRARPSPSARRTSAACCATSSG